MGVEGGKANAWLGIAATIAAAGIMAQEATDDAAIEEDAVIEEVVVKVGTRAAPRTAPSSPVPVDSIDAEALAVQGGADMSNLLRAAIPSFHVNTNPSRDAAALARPVNLRGLAPDHTLVLVNNKRRHRGAVIQWISNGASDGAQGPDFSSIPVSAIDRVEVLRDGASSQYGSDAIAGVVNFVLKDAQDGGSLEAKGGLYTKDTSESKTMLAGNVGLPFGANGFINLSAEYNARTATDRSVQHPDAVAMASLGVNVADPAKPWGDAKEEGFKTFANMGFDLTERVRGYAFGNYATREVETPFFYRSPQGRSGVYQNGGRVLVGGAAGCQARYDYEATPENVVMVRDMVAGDPNCFAFVEMLPGGFTPRFGATVTDFSAVAGLSGTLPNGVIYDLSVSQGRNAVEFYIEDTVNASYGPNTPRAFDLGDYVQTDTTLHAEAVYLMDVGLASDLNVAGGLEWRNERFEIEAGERASWDTGPYGADGFSARANGFGGFNPASAGEWDRANAAAYLDLETAVTQRWRLGAAVRWEDFDDFGEVLTHKVTSHLRLAPGLAVRASGGSGFRAPTPGQQNANNLSTVVDSATGVFREQGTVASTNPVALQLGGRPLDAERSRNWTLGFVLEPSDNTSLILDWFRIDLFDRIALSANMDVDDDLVARLAASGVASAADFQRIRYFTNDYDTETKGVDVVLTHSVPNAWGDTNFTVSYNRTATKVKEAEQASTTTRERSIEHGVPGTRLSAGLNHTTGAWDLAARYNYYGSWFDSDDGATHNGYGYLDVSARYNWNDRMSFSIGSDNVFDKYPDKAYRSPSSGRLYPRYSPAGYNGRMVFGRLQYRFGAAPPPPPPAPPPAPPPKPQPAPPPEPPPSPPEELVVLFDFDQADISPSAGDRLDRYADDVRAYDSKVAAEVRCAILVEGHADSLGSDPYNQGLGMRRAEAVRDRLVGGGIAGERIETVSWGETRPVSPGTDSGARAQNRRAVVNCR